MTRLNGVVRTASMGPASGAPPICTLPPPTEGCQSSSTQTQQPPLEPLPLEDKAVPPLLPPETVPAVESALWLPVRFFQLCERLSHWGWNFHSCPFHMRIQRTSPAVLIRRMSSALTLA
jgi:hypothetical protein